MTNSLRAQFIIPFIIVFLSTMLFGTARAAVSPPNIVSYQGRVLNTNGVPISDTSVSITFNLYTVASGGSSIWTTTKAVSLTSGLFSENLGDTSAGYAAIPDTVFANNAAVYLGVTIGSDTEMIPRKRITAAPYALNSQTLDGLDSTAFLQTTSSLDSSKLTGALPSIDGSALTNLSSGNLVGALPAISGASLTGLSKTQVGLGNVENTTLSTWGGSTNITSVGTISTGTWSGSFGAVSGANLISLTPSNIAAGTAGINITGNAATVSNGVYTTGSYADPTWITSLAASKVGLGNVENTAISSWPGSTAITTLGTIGTGVWNGTAINYSKLNIANGDLTIAKTSGLQTALDAKQNNLVNSSGLASALSDETGSGTAVFGTSPNITTPTGIVKGDVGLGNVDNTSDANKPVSTAQQTALDLKQNVAGKDASDGYAGLSLFKINFKNAANTFTSYFTNSNTASRTYTFQDRSGTIADDTDLATKQGTLTNSAGLAAALSDETGTGSAVFSNSPVLVSPSLGAASATSINGLTIGATGGALNIVSGSTLTTSGAFSTTLTSTNTTNVTLPTSGTLVGSADTGTVTSTMIANGTILNADVNASAAIDFSKLAPLTSGNILVGSSGNVATSVAMSGNGTLSNTGALTISALAITNGMLAGGIDLTSKVTGTLPVANGGTGATTFGGDNTILYTTSADSMNKITTGNSGVLITSGAGVPSISSTIPNATQDNITRLGTIASGVWNGTTIAVANGGTGATSLALNGVLYGATSAVGATTAGTDGQFFIASTGAAPHFSTMSNDATISNTGALTIANGAITSAKAGTNLDFSNFADAMTIDFATTITGAAGKTLTLTRTATANASEDGFNIGFTPASGDGTNTYSALTVNATSVAGSVDGNSLYGMWIKSLPSNQANIEESAIAIGSNWTNAMKFANDSNFQLADTKTLYFKDPSGNELAHIADAGTTGEFRSTGTVVVGTSASDNMYISKNSIYATAAGTIDLFNNDPTGVKTINFGTSFTTNLNLGSVGTTTTLKGGAASLIDFPNFDVAATTNAVTLTQEILGTSPLTINGITNENVPLIDLNVNNVSGNLMNADYQANTTLSGSITGFNLNVGNHDLITVTNSNNSVVGMNMTLPQATSLDGTKSIIGFQVDNAGDVTSTAGNNFWNGYLAKLPTVTQTAGTLIASGYATTISPALLNSGTYNGLKITHSATVQTAGEIDDISIGAISASGGTTNAIKIGDMTDTGATTTGIMVGAGWDNNLFFDDVSTNIGIRNSGTFTFTDGTNTLMSLADNGTTGNLTVTGGVIGPGSDAYIDFPNFDVAATTNAVTLAQEALGTTPLTINGITSGNVPEIAVTTKNVSGNLINVSYPEGTTITSALSGLNVDLSTNITNTSGTTVTGFSLSLPTVTGMSGSKKVSGFSIETPGNVTSSGGANNRWNGFFAQLPVLTQSGGTLSANGVSILIPASSLTSGTYNGFNLTETGTESSGTVNAMNIGAMQASGGSTANGISIGDMSDGGATTTGILIGKGWDTSINSTTGAADANGTDLRIQSGDGGTATGDGKTGGTISLTGGLGSAKAGGGVTDGQGGSITITGGNAGGITNGVGGSVTIDAGVKTGAGSNGLIRLGTTNASSIVIGNSGTSTFYFGNIGGTKTIDIGGVDSDGNDTVNIATNNTSADTINIGSTNAVTQITGGGAWSISPAGAAVFTLTNNGTQAVCFTGGANGDGGTHTLTDCSGAPVADYAEQYPVAQGVVFGDIVVPGAKEVITKNGDHIVQLVKSSEAYQGPVSGIVSNNTGDFTSAGYNVPAEENPMSIALVGRVPVNVTNENGPIAVGDYVTTSSTHGKGMKATQAGRVIGMALSSFDGVSGQVMVQVNNSWSFGNLIGTDGTSSMFTDNVITAPVGKATAEAPAFDSFGLALRGSAWDGNQAQAVQMLVKNVVTDTNNYRLSVRNTADSEVAYVTNTGTMQVAGDMVVGGKIYPSDQGAAQKSKYIYYDGSLGPAGDYMRTNAKGWSTGSYDFAEMFPSSESLRPGEVVVFGTNSVDVERSTKANEKSIAGIVSTRPGFLAGDNAQGSYPIALAGRVPTNVNLEGGAINVGDPLTTSSQEGYAMKAKKAGQIVGYALEKFDGSTSNQITVFVNAGYWGGESTSQTPGTNNQASLFAQGGSESMSALNMSGNINMNGNDLLSIGRIAGLSGAWSIESDGTIKTTTLLKTVITGQNNKQVETISVTSPEVVITLSGTAKLENGKAEIKFADASPDFANVISATAPIRVIATPNGPVSLYVSEKDQNHFVVQSFGSGVSDVEFDWMVTAYRKGYEPVDSSKQQVAGSVATETTNVVSDTTTTVPSSDVSVTSDTSVASSPAPSTSSSSPSVDQTVNTSESPNTQTVSP